jgi:excinuclease ABC subunit A
MDYIIIRGAHENNLKDVSLTLPRNRLIVITGVSGSGKSTLAFDTIFAEGQRRYLEALSTRTRQFLQRLDAPKVDAVEGLSPAVAVRQGNPARNPRSTVGTLTENHDFLRLLYARLGTLHCPACGVIVRAYTIAQMLQEILNAWPTGSRLLVLGPIGSIAERELPKTISRFRRDGFARIRLENKIYDLDPPPLIPRRNLYRIDVVVDRIMLDPDKTKRLTDALELASKVGGGLVGVTQATGGDRWFSEFLKCLSCGRQMSELTPSLFSFNHPLGACPSCKGLGYTEFVCPECGGSRLNEVARSVRLGELTIQDVCRLAVSDLTKWLKDLPLASIQKEIAARPIEEILHRLRSLEHLGLAYLTLERSASSLSGGEMQRLRLAHQVSAPLSGILYVLDEPSIGLHPRDHQRLLDILHELRDKGNTLIVVEHDRETILQADFVVDMGPGAGIHGGEVVFAGTPEALFHCSASLTGAYLSGRESIPIPERRKPFEQGSITLVGASAQNLKGITVRFPLGCMSCVTGVSGSGKTTLIIQTLYNALTKHLCDSSILPVQFDALENTEALRKVILVDQSPLGRTARSTPATYSGTFSAIRELFSRLPEAKVRGYGPKRFSFNAKGGRCESCRGEGIQNVEMFFLPSISVSCPDCEGKRYNRETLQVTFKGYSIADILHMSVAEAFGLFGNIPGIAHKLEVFMEVGLGYLRLGQSAATLSGGEAQRVKLATELSRKSPPATLYILDEPTTGLHFDDIQKLLLLLQRLVDQGHTVLMIEHHPDVIKTADYVIDLGPEGGDQGGYLMAAGSPEEIAKIDTSHTGRFLRQFFE